MTLSWKWQLVGALTTLALVGCQGQSEVFVTADNSLKEDQQKLDNDLDVAVSRLPHAKVQGVGAAGVPTFVTGDLGKIDRTVAFSPVGQSMRAALDQIAPVFRLSPGDLSVRAAFTDNLGFHHTFYTQTKNGLPVVGGELAIHVNADGQIYAANGSARDGVSLSPAALVTERAAALAAQRGSAEVSAINAGSSRLVYLLADGKTMHLAWEVEITGFKGQDPVRDLVYVNARNGEVIERHPQIHFAKNREMHNLNHGTTLPGPLARTEGGAPSSDSIVNENYDRLGTVYDCYATLFGRDSFDNAGAKLISSVHYSNNYVNAYWNGTQMVYGDGDGVDADNLAKSLDVTAHELTHAVTERTANLVYSGESGGLNESMSDVFGNVCEAFRDGVSANTWKVGEDVWTPGTAGDALRYMNDPRLDGSSIDYYSDYYSGLDVHYSSGLGNLAFYLTSQGGTHPRGRSSVVVPAITITKAQQIWYRALTVYMSANTDFLGAKNATVQAATDLYTATEVDAVTKAWAAVGVPPPPPVTTPLSNGVPVTNISGASASKKYYSLDVPAGQTTLVFQTSGGTGDADLYVKLGSAPTTSSYDCRPYASGNAETCTFTSPAAGTWYVMLNGYSSYSGLSLTGTYSVTGDTTPPLTNGVPVIDISGATSSAQYWKLAVPSGKTSVVFTITGQTGTSGDADLYVRRGSKPTTTTYDCRPYLSGNNETCTISNPVAGDYFVMIRGYTAFTKVTLKGQY